MVSESQLVKRFAELSTSQQSVETLSLFLMHHRRHSQTIVHIWSKELVATTPERKIGKNRISQVFARSENSNVLSCLAFLYVANDVIQHDKRKGGDFGRDFLPLLPAAIEHIIGRVNDENIRRTVKRIIQIWSERGVYDSDAIKLLKSSYEKGVRRLEVKRKTIRFFLFFALRSIVEIRTAMTMPKETM